MKVTIDGMTFEGSEDEIERIAQKFRPPTVTAHVVYAPAGLPPSAAEEPR